MFSTKAFAWYNLVEITIAIPFFFAVHGYLVIMSLNMQRIFRKYGQVKGYFAEVIVLTDCFFCMGHLLFFTSKPILIFFINTLNYECSSKMSRVMSVLEYWDLLCWPFSFQLVFIALMWQMSRIQKNAGESSGY